MPNLYLNEIAELELVTQGASCLQLFRPKNVSTVPGCIQLVLRDKSLQAFSKGARL